MINETEHAGCRYTLNNRWPIDQTWLYVDDTGLHTRLIDREDESIAFMALSQVQVELTLECDSDNSIVRNKRSIDDIETRLGPYDYGDNKWALTDSILYNPRRSLVNLIVNDINDNAPVFVGKEQEPLLFGYPIPDLEERVLPRALAELKVRTMTHRSHEYKTNPFIRMEFDILRLSFTSIFNVRHCINSFESAYITFINYQ